ncbi:hypothetical protein GCM10011418_20040 [Sphingobacterium alkalisoli]|nr:hypothetical protein GCM10011418_20040 [Sphingobacterium alkalisoli]
MTPITSPTIINIEWNPNNHDGIKKPKFKFFNNKNAPNKTIQAPTMVALLLLFGGGGV